MRSCSRRCRSTVVIPDADAVVDQERRATVDHRMRSRWAVWGVAHTGGPCALSVAILGQTRGDNWLGMVRIDGISVSVAVVIGLSNRYML